MPLNSRNLLWILGLIAFAAAAYFFSDILTYILIAWVFSLLGRPVMNFLLNKVRIRQWKIGPAMASLITIFSFFLVIAGVLLIFLPKVVSQARKLAAVDYRAIGEKYKEPFANLDQRLHELGLLGQDESLATRTQELLSQWFRPALLGDFLETFFATAGNVLVTITAVTFILFFFLKDKDLFMDMLHVVVPNELEEKVVHAVNDSTDVLTRYFGGLVTQMAAFTTILTVSLWILGVENAFLIGAFGGLFNVIPYVGPIFGMVFGCFITASSHLDLDIQLIVPMLLKVIGGFALTQFFDNNILGPIIFSKSVKAHPLEIFLVIIIAAKVGGVIGMVIGIPVYTVLRVIARIFFSEFSVVQRWTSHIDEEDEA